MGSWCPISEYICVLVATLVVKPLNLGIIQVYALTSDTEDVEGRIKNFGGVGGTVASDSALRSAGTLLSRVRALPSASRPDGEP
ncbi:hypothetical protein PoB_002022500 [Plakobranchus ocellatus]|uniref:Uncharacterized protein n=1 Tax=Plakobranchus ocellatus TaxID=259542 RepID=A0AAV3ZEZ3_9GAST|nr:hypothetical protein PoB_002022500 [Plakobranchus ocellatus]